MDEEQYYCELCWREITIYQETIGEGFCDECQAIEEEKEAL